MKINTDSLTRRSRYICFIKKCSGSLGLQVAEPLSRVYHAHAHSGKTARLFKDTWWSGFETGCRFLELETLINLLRYV